MTPGVWTEIEWTVLAPDERPQSTPADTRATPYLARANGMAIDPVVGQQAEITTVTGRTLRGTVTAVNPGYRHSFGVPSTEWTRMRDRINVQVHP